VVAHPSDIAPRNVRLSGKHLRVDVLDGLADLDEAKAHCVEDEPVVEEAR
jgi:hypothetical protein